MPSRGYSLMWRFEDRTTTLKCQFDQQLLHHSLLHLRILHPQLDLHHRRGNGGALCFFLRTILATSALIAYIRMTEYDYNINLQLTITSSTAQGSGGSFKNRKPIGELGCCESRMAERSHWWIERWLMFPLFLSLFLSFSDYLPTYLAIYRPICLSIYLPIYLSFSLSISLSHLSIYLSIYPSIHSSIHPPIHPIYLSI